MMFCSVAVVCIQHFICKRVASGAAGGTRGCSRVCGLRRGSWRRCRSTGGDNSSDLGQSGWFGVVNRRGRVLVITLLFNNHWFRLWSLVGWQGINSNDSSGGYVNSFGRDLRRDGSEHRQGQQLHNE